MNKTLCRQVLCCGMALLTMAPILSGSVQQAAPVVAHAKAKAKNGKAKVPKYLENNLVDMYGKKKAYSFTPAEATKLGKRFEKDWKNQAGGAYGHMSKNAYFKRLYNEYALRGDINANKGQPTFKLDNYLENKLTGSQINAINAGEPVKGLNKTEKKMLNKYGITNQLYKRTNNDHLSSGDYKDLQFPGAAELTDKQKSEIRNDKKVKGLNGLQTQVLGEYGIQVTNGQTPATMHTAYMQDLACENVKKGKKNSVQPNSIRAMGKNPSKAFGNGDPYETAKEALAGGMQADGTPRRCF